MKAYKAELALLLVTMIWGLTFPVIRNAIAIIDPYQFVFFRFLLATVAFSFFLIRRGNFSRHELRISVLISFILWASYITQTIGMETIASGRAAFITGMNVIMVPFFAPFFGLKRPTRIDLLAACGASAGLFMLTQPTSGGIEVGDLWVFLCAITYALYIVLLQKALDHSNVDTTRFSFLQVLGVFVFSSLCLPFSRRTISWPQSKEVWVGLLFCSTFATIGTSWLQTKYQKYTTAQRTALIFSMEPVFAAMFGYMMLNEKMTTKSILGASVILISIILCELIKIKRAP